MGPCQKLLTDLDRRCLLPYPTQRNLKYCGKLLKVALPLIVHVRTRAEGDITGARSGNNSG